MKLTVQPHHLVTFSAPLPIMKNLLFSLLPLHFLPSVIADGCTINLGVVVGTPLHAVAGLNYGIPDNANQIPSHFYSDIGFNYARAGGAQLGAPARGWIYGAVEYKVLETRSPAQNINVVYLSISSVFRTAFNQPYQITRPLYNMVVVFN